MTGPRTAVGAVTIPEVWVRDTRANAWVSDGRLPGRGEDSELDDNGLEYTVRERIHGVSLRDGRWMLTALDAFANQGAPWEDLDFDLRTDAAGNALLVYRRLTDLGGGRSEAQVLAREYLAAAGAWGAPVRLDAPSVGITDGGQAPQLALAPNGDAAVYFEDWVCPDGAAYCQATANWLRRRVGGAWQPAQVVNQDARSPSDMAAAVGADGTASVFWRPFQSGDANAGLDLAARAVRTDGTLGPVVRSPAASGFPRAVGGPGGSALVTTQRVNAGADRRYTLAATRFDGGAFGPVTELSTTRYTGDFQALEGTSEAASVLYVEGGWRLGTGPLDSGFLLLDPLKRRLMMRRWAGDAWSAPIPVDGGLPAPAQQSVVGPDDVAAGGGVVIFAAGRPSPDGLRGADRVYAVDASGPAPSAPVAIDNGPGGWVHAVAVDRSADGGAAALFTQLGPDGNVRLYGVENVAASAPVSRRPAFGVERCTDAASQIAGCASAALEPVRALPAAPVAARDGALVVRGAAVQVLSAPAVVRSATARGHAAATRTRRLKTGTVSVAVQQTTARRGCRWWNASRRRFAAGSCREPRFTSVKVRDGRFTLRLRGLPAGRVTVLTRAARGKLRQQVLRLGESRRVVTVRRGR
jgi:hypothetical protein